MLPHSLLARPPLVGCGGVLGVRAERIVEADWADWELPAQQLDHEELRGLARGVFSGEGLNSNRE